MSATTEQEVEVLMSELDRIKELAGEEEDLPVITELFERIDVQLNAKFKPVQKRKRVENQLTGGMITWGDVPSPIQKYEGPTSRRALREARNIAPPDSVYNPDWFSENISKYSEGGNAAYYLLAYLLHEARPAKVQEYQTS